MEDVSGCGVVGGKGVAWCVGLKRGCGVVGGGRVAWCGGLERRRVGGAVGGGEWSGGIVPCTLEQGRSLIVSAVRASVPSPLYSY